METGPGGLEATERLWPLVEHVAAGGDVAGVAVAVVHEGETVARGFGVRDARTGTPVTPETMFHLASVSKPFVATAVVSLAMDPDTALDLDAPVTDLVPELSLADGRAGEVTARTLLSHTSGLPDVSEYGWHDPQLGDDALSAFVADLSDWRLRSDPGTEFSYSNAGYEVLGLLLARAAGTTFEEAVRRQVLAPLGMPTSTFLRSEVPPDLAASPHVGMPPAVPGDAYPYTRRHAPSSTLHSNLVELCRWVEAHLEPETVAEDGWASRRDRMWTPVAEVGEPPWEEAMALGWAVGSHAGHRTLGHSGADPGFGSSLVVVPERRIGVVVLANSNTVPTSAITSAALDLVLGEAGSGEATLRERLPTGVLPVAEACGTSGPEVAEATYRRLAATSPPTHDLDDDEFEKAVWGAIELHRTGTVWPLLRLWTAVRPESSVAWTMNGWAHQVDGDPDRARSLLSRALELDPDNEEAALILGNLPSP